MPPFGGEIAEYQHEHCHEQANRNGSEGECHHFWVFDGDKLARIFVQHNTVGQANAEQQIKHWSAKTGAQPHSSEAILGHRNVRHEITNRIAERQNG